MSGFGGGNTTIGPSTAVSSQSVTIATDQAPVPFTLDDGTNAVTIVPGSETPSAANPALNVIISPNQTPISVTVSGGVERFTTGNITSTQSVYIDTTSAGTCGIVISGTWTGQIDFESTVDSINWIAINASIPNDGTEQFTLVNGTWTIACAGFQKIRVIGNTVLTGSATAFLNASTSQQIVSIVNPLPTGTNTIGKVDQGAKNTLANAWPIKLTDGTNVMPTGDSIARPLYVTMTDGFDTPTITLDGALKVDGSGVNQPITVASLPLPSGAAQDSTLTGGTQKAIPRGAAKGATSAIDITGTTEGTDHNSLDVQIYHGGAAKDPTQIRALTSSDVVTAAQATAGNLNATVVQSTGSNLHTVVDSGAVTVSQSTASNLNANVSQATGSNLHTVVDSGSVTVSGTATVSQSTGTNLHTVVDSGAVTVSQGTASNLNANVSQATGTNLHTVVDSGAVTVSQGTSSNLKAVVDQGTAAALNAPWTVKVTDGTNTFPTMDVAARAGFEKITDGTNTAAVKAASTASASTDPALVVSLSPNNSALYGAINSSWHGDPSSYLTTEKRQLSIASDGRLETFGSVTSDAGSFRDDFIGTALTSSIGTVTFTNNSTDVVGVGTSFTTTVKTGQWIKKSADSETLYVEVDKVNSDTSLTLVTAYQGTSTSEAAVTSNWHSSTAPGGSITVASSAVNLASGVTSGQNSHIHRSGDYLPFTCRVYASISQRIANQNAVIGFRNDTDTPAIKAEVNFTGTDNTKVDFITSSSSAAADIQTTTLSLPNLGTTNTQHVYKIELAQAQVILSIDEIICAIHELHIPGPYDQLDLYAGIVNTATAAGSTTLSVDSVYFSNVARVEISSEFNGQPLNVQIVGKTAAGVQIPIRSTSSNDLSVEIDGSNVSAFGDIITAPNYPIMQFDFVTLPVTAGVMNQIGGAYITNSATAGVNNGRLALATGVNSAGSSVYISAKAARYRAGQGVTARFTAAWATSAASSTQVIGMCAPVLTWTGAPAAPGQPITAVAVGDGFFFGYDGTSFGIRHKNSRTSLDTWYPQTEWNIDKCDGTGGIYNGSGFNWDKTKGNVMMIRYPYLGYGNIKFFVQHDRTGAWIMCHIIKYTNTTAEVQVNNPSFNFFAQVINAGSTTNLTMYVGSVGVLLSGEQQFLGPQFAYDARLSVSQAELPVMSVRNCTSLNGVPNKGMIRLRSMSVSGDGANTDCRIRIRRNATLTNATFAIPVYGTITASSVGYILTAAQSCATIDIAATAVAAVSAGAVDVLFNTVIARNTGYQIDLTPFDIFIVPGDTATVTAICGANSNLIQVALNWNEDT